MYKKSKAISSMTKPKLINVMASSLDGEIASQRLESDSLRQSTGLSCREDHRRLLLELKGADGVIVGAKTLRADGAVLEQKNYRGIEVPWVVLSRSGLAADLAFWRQTRVQRTIVSPMPVQQWDCRVRNIVCDDPAAIAERALEVLTTAGAKRILLFGGGEINALFYRAGLVDELKLTLSPLMIGVGVSRLIACDAKSLQVNFELLSCEDYESYLFLHYRVK